MSPRTANEAHQRRPAIALASEEGRLREVEAVPEVVPLPSADEGGKRPAVWMSREWRRFAAAFLAVLSVVALAYPFLPRRYESYASVVIQPTDADGQTDRTLSRPMDENAIQSVIDQIASPALADAVIDRHGLEGDTEFGGGAGLRDRVASAVPWLGAVLPSARVRTRSDLRQSLQDHLQVYRDKKSYTVRLGYWSSSPTKAAAMTATLLQAFLDGQRDRKRGSLLRLSEWLGQRVALLTSRYEASRRKVTDYLAASGLIDAGAQVALERRLQVLSGEAAQARARHIDAAVRAEALDAMRRSGALDGAPEVLASPSVMRLKEGMAAALAKTAVWAAETSSFERQISVEIDRIVSAAHAEAASWRGREARLQEEVDSVRAALVRRREAEQRLQELQRASDADRIVMDEGLSRLKGMTSRAEAVGADSDVLSLAETPTSAAFPRPGTTLAAALLLAALVGLLFVWRPVLGAARRLASA